MTNPYAKETPSWLHDIWEAAQERAKLRAAFDVGDAKWRALITNAVEAGYRVTDVAEAACISRERVYQILGEQK